MNEHTPGVWRTGKKVFRTVYADDKLIGVMDRREDATLVASAPELLRACEAAISMLRCAVAHGTSTIEGFDVEEHHGITQLREAIAKAKGTL